MFQTTNQIVTMGHDDVRHGEYGDKESHSSNRELWPMEPYHGGAKTLEGWDFNRLQGSSWFHSNQRYVNIANIIENDIVFHYSNIVQ